MKNTSERQHYVDIIRIFLTFLVVAHHAGRAFGRWSGWWFVKVPLAEQTTNLIPFFAINAAFLMTFFFFISAYFMPGAYDRKGYPEFGNNRNRRMLVPLVFFVLVIMPIETYYYYKLFMVSSPECSGCMDMGFFEFYYLIYLGIGGKPSGWDATGFPSWPGINLGHIWFLEHLLVYGLVYALYRRFGKSISIKLNFPSSKKIIVSGLILAIITFLFRIIYPINDWTGLFYVFQVEFGHFPHYIFISFIGVAAYRHQWITKENFTQPFGMKWLITGITGIFIIVGIGLFIPLDSPEIQGGFGILAFCYAIIEIFTCFGLLIGMIWFTMNFMNKTSKIKDFLSENSYMVYLIHQPIIILIQYWLYSINIDTNVKFLICLGMSIPISFLFSYLLRLLIPYAKKNL